jgi:hypothetical protein
MFLKVVIYILSEEKAKERRRFQVPVQFYSKITQIWDDDAKVAHPPEENFTVDTDFEFEPWMLNIRRNIVSIDESWVNLSLKSDSVWIDLLGDDVAQSEGGERYIVIVAVDKDGFVGWNEDDYGKINHLWMFPNGESSAMIKLHSKAVEKAAQFDDEFEQGRAPEEGRGWIGGGVIMMPSKTSSAEFSGAAPQTASSYKLTMDGRVKLDYMRHLCEVVKEPTLFVLDKAPYNLTMPDIGFNPHDPSATLDSALEFLKSEYLRCKTSPFAVLLKSYYHVATPKGDVRIVKKTTGAVKGDILADLRELIKKPALTEIEMLVAESGIRRFGYPHLVVILPARMPSWDPVELVFAQMKQIFKTHRVINRGKDNSLGNMGLNEYRQALCRMWAYFDRGKVSRCVDHVDWLWEVEWTAYEGNETQSQRLKDELKDLMEQHNLEAPRTTRNMAAYLFDIEQRTPERDTHDKVRTGLTPKRKSWPLGRYRLMSSKFNRTYTHISGNSSCRRIDFTSNATTSSARKRISKRR